jgi:hypothetical protein
MITGFHQIPVRAAYCRTPAGGTLLSDSLGGGIVSLEGEDTSCAVLAKSSKLLEGKNRHVGRKTVWAVLEKKRHMALKENAQPGHQCVG